MIYLGFPYGSNFGWGVLGKEVALAMSQLTDVRLLSPPDADQRLDDEFDRYQIRQLLAPLEQHGRLDGPVIQAVIGRSLEPFVRGLAPPAAVGYAVFEESILCKAAVAKARRQYRHLAAGSSYCADVLRQHGLTDVSTIPHGVDTTLFCPRAEPRSFLKDRFIVFSGGKFELRKGQDIVIRAYKVLQDRHKDVMLVNSWHNVWPKQRDTMAASTLIRYRPPHAAGGKGAENGSPLAPRGREVGGEGAESPLAPRGRGVGGEGDYIAWMNSLLAAHGIDIERVITVGPRDHRLLPGLYHSTDLGLFPNRVEGGNNMVLMEYLACGKPALVSFNSGHTDMVRRNNAVLIECHKPMERRIGGELTGVWNDPSLGETIDKLEWCYQHRGELQPLAEQAAVDMREFSWHRLAKGLLQMVEGLRTHLQ